MKGQSNLKNKFSIITNENRYICISVLYIISNYSQIIFNDLKRKYLAKVHLQNIQLYNQTVFGMFKILSQNIVRSDKEM